MNVESQMCECGDATNFVISFITNTLAIMLAQIWMMTTIELSAAS